MVLPVYAGNLAAQAAGSILALEHALTMLLLLTGLLVIQENANECAVRAHLRINMDKLLIIY